MMKIIYGFLLCFALAACQSGEAKKDEETKTNSSEWFELDGKSADSKEIVMISGDEEYRSEEALTQLAKIMSERHGFQCRVLYAQDPSKAGIVDGNFQKNIPGLEALETADLMVVFTRFRALPDDQMKYIDDYLKDGKPVVGIRTATHAFKFNEDSTSSFAHYDNYYKGEKEEWKGGFGKLVLGENWVNHHGHHKHQSTRGVIAEGMEGEDIVNGLTSGKIWGSTDVYGVNLPLSGDGRAVILGQVVNRKGEFDENDIFYGMRDTDQELATENNEGTTVNETLMPIAWTRTYKLPEGQKSGRAFTSTIGSSSDLLDEGVRRLLVNGMFWAMSLPVPDAVNVDLVGEYKPTAYGFKKDAYWDEKQTKVLNFYNE